MSLASLPIPTNLITAEQFAERPDPGYSEELVHGRIVPMPVPQSRHGQICNRAGRIFGNFADDYNLGHVLSNDSGVITERSPDTVRGADVAFYGYARVPKGPLPHGYLPVPPEIVVEVVSPIDRWPKVLAKVAEYLQVGVLVVIVLDGEKTIAMIFREDGTTRTLEADAELSLPDLLPGFSVSVRRFFE